MYDIPDNLFKGLSVLFVHSHEHKRQHHDYHNDCRYARIHKALAQEKQRYTYSRTGAEANKLSLCEVEHYLCLNCVKVFGYGHISHSESPPFLMCREDGFCHRTCLKEGEAQKNRVAHTSPDCSTNVCFNGDVLNESRIDRHTDDNEKCLER